MNNNFFPDDVVCFKEETIPKKTFFVESTGMWMYLDFSLALFFQHYCE